MGYKVCKYYCMLLKWLSISLHFRSSQLVLLLHFLIKEQFTYQHHDISITINKGRHVSRSKIAVRIHRESDMKLTALSCVFVVFEGLLSVCNTELSPSYYDETCPNVYDIVYGVVEKAAEIDPRIGASLLRLHFHDCFVQVML